MKTAITILLLMFFANNIDAQIYFKNNTKKPVFVATCKHYKQKGEEYWFSRGWTRVDPGEKKEVAAGVGFNNNFYYYAKSAIDKDVYEGTSSILVDPKEGFYIKNANMEYKKKEHPEYQWVKMRKIDMDLGVLQTKYTIEFNY